MIQLRIDTRELRRHARRLEQISRAALPVAVRGALNNAAFDLKQNTMPAGAARNFQHRRPNFFKANSRVLAARGLDIGSMEATVGFMSKGGRDQSVDDLKQQEHGGSIPGRAFVPLRQARSGNSWTRMVRAAARISKIKSRVIDANDAKAANDGQRFIKSVIHAGPGGFVLGAGTNGAGNRTLFEVRSVRRGKKGVVIKTRPIMAVKRGRKARVKATHFMENATHKSAKQLEQHFIKQAQARIAQVR